MTNYSCIVECFAMPVCLKCHLRKHPRGRDPGLEATAGYCAWECPGHTESPQAGHLWPGEQPDHMTETEAAALPAGDPRRVWFDRLLAEERNDGERNQP